ncbi:MAG: NifU family protein [Candidatus Omnitrophica bacterium]|nr:NifU family protein [Candidatus Omnitrophota bacterium]
MTETNAEFEKINDILNHTVRPFMQKDGGDLKLIGLEGNILTISYQGACGGCPHAKMGTLLAIETALKEHYNPDIKVQTTE